MGTHKAAAELQSALRDSAAKAIVESQNGHFSVDIDAFRREFLKSWVMFLSAESIDSAPKNGSILFLFFKNAGVTNIQHAELVHLVRNHSKILFEKDANLIFATTKEYEFFIKNICSSYFEIDAPFRTRTSALEAMGEMAEHVTIDYGDIIRTTIILDFYYTSAVMHVPISIHVDLRTITLSSGYIHSSGGALYVRRLDKTRSDELLSSLRAASPPNLPKPTYLIPYADEFFRPYEHGVTSTRDGLDGVSLKLAKHFIGHEPIDDILTAISADTECKYYVAPGLKDYRQERDAADVASNYSVWFITDGTLVATKASPYRCGDELYFIAYKQFFFNDNPLLFFKERKPAWFASTTIPHSLSRCMLNLARKRGSKSEPIDILDPFAGTGTTLIDAYIGYPNAKIVGLDIDKGAACEIEDNLDFFTWNRERIGNFMRGCSASVTKENFLEDVIQNVRMPAGDDFDDLFCAAFEAVRALVWPNGLPTTDSGWLRSDDAVSEVLEKGYPESLTKTILGRGTPAEMKILFYFIWRAVVMNRYQIKHNKVSGLLRSIREELGKAAREMGEYHQALRSRSLREGVGFSWGRGLFSEMGTISPSLFRKLREAFHVVGEDGVIGAEPGIYVVSGVDCVEYMRERRNCYDIVVGDPPYGFNKGKSESRVLQELYRDYIKAAVSCVRPGGDLIIAVPNFSRNGRSIPFYQTRRSIVPQVLIAARKLGKEVVTVANSSPEIGVPMGPPYYWGSRATISRNILHFHIAGGQQNRIRHQRR